MKEISLNTKQKEAVYHFNGPLMILAGAGSGKTRVITHKIANLINNCNISPRNIMGVTFTNKAASEMKDRLIEMLGKGNIKGLILSTFHSLCSNILRKHAGVINYQANFSIYGESDQLSMIKQIILDLGYSKEQIDAYDVASIIGRAKNQLLFPEHVSENHSLGWDEAFIKIYKYYQNRLKAHQAMDFDDLILNTVYLLNNHKNIKDKLINQYKYILVDEYQDTNYAQFELLKLLTHDQSNITIVGDDDQSIYSWRGAESSNFLRFEKEYKNVNTIILDQNYRSTNTILKSANAIIQKNTNRKPKNLKSNKGTGDLIAYYECEEEEDEAFTIADIILSKKIREKIRYHNFAILYRTNYQSRPFETAFRERNIPYRIIGGISFYDRKEIKDLVAYLKLINNLEDDISLLRIVNYPKRGIGETSIESFRKHALNNKLSLFQAMGETSKIDELDIKAKARITEFVDLIDSFKKEFETNSLSSCLKRLVDNIDYESAIFKICQDETEWNRKRSNIRDFIQMMESYEKKQNDDIYEDYKPTLRGFLNSVSLLYDIPNKGEEEISDDNVTLLTLHSAKGLEFPHVFLVGMEEKILPHGNNENIEEERRLCYVGFTRAMDTLTLTSCKTRKKYGNMEDRTPSRFIDDIPNDLIGLKSQNQQEDLSSEEAGDYFSYMKNILTD